MYFEYLGSCKKKLQKLALVIKLKHLLGVWHDPLNMAMAWWLLRKVINAVVPVRSHIILLEEELS